MAPNDHVVEKFTLIDRGTLLESEKVLLLVGEGHFFHGLYVAILVLK